MNLIWKIVGEESGVNTLLVRHWEPASIEPGLLSSEVVDAEYVIFHVASGDTHLIGYSAMTILRALQNKPADTDDVIKELALFSGIDVNTELETIAEQTLTDLARLGVIEKSNP